MPGQGIQHLPWARIPKEWNPQWFAEVIRDVLALADTRNALEGSGIIITGQPNEPATISTSEDLQNLLLQSFVLATPSGFLNFERVLTAGDAIDIVDGGANSTITVSVEDGGINLGKLAELSDMGVLGNPVNGIGAVQNIQAELDGDVLTRQGVDLVFTNAPIWTGNHRWIDTAFAQWGTDGDLSISHNGASGAIVNTTGALAITTTSNLLLSVAGDVLVNGVTLTEFTQDAVGAILTDTASIDLVYNDGANTITANLIDEYAQDLVGAMLADSTSIDFTYNDGAGTFTASTINANPSGLIGMTAVNGAAATPLRSDGRHAIDPAIAPTWTGVHTFGNDINGATLLNFTIGGANTVGVDSTGIFSFVDNLKSLGNPTHRWSTVYAASVQDSTDELIGSTGVNVRVGAGASWTSLSLYTVGAERLRVSASSVIVRNGNLLLETDNNELQVGASQDLRLYHDGTNSFVRNDTGVLNINQGATTVGRFDSDATAGNTRFMVYDVDNATLERVSVGAANSGGAGFKYLRIPN